MPVEVKICGLSTSETVQAATEAGADLIGFVFFPKSPRNVSLEQAASLAGLARGKAKIVALTVDAIPGRQFVGHIERFAPATGSEFSVIRPDNATGNFIKVSQRLPVRITVAPGQAGAELLAPGVSVVGRVDATQPPVAGAPAGF